MPEAYKERFLKLEKENIFLKNVFIDDNKVSFRIALRSSVNYFTKESEAVITFRIDNDDAVPIDFIKNLSRFTHAQFIGHCISTPVIYGIQHIASHTYMVEELYFPANAVGLAYVSHLAEYKTILELGDHDLVNNNNNLILLPKSENVGIMTINGENEINKIDKSKARNYNEADLQKYLKEKGFYYFDLNCLDILKVESRFSLKNIARLFMPPIYWKAHQKLKHFLVHMK